MKKINIIFVGCGRVAQHYKSLIKDNPIKEIKISGAFDTNLEIAKKVIELGAEKIYLNRSVLNKKSIVMVVVTPIKLIKAVFFIIFQTGVLRYTISLSKTWIRTSHTIKITISV